MPIKISGNQELEVKFPETFLNQCVCLRTRCSKCGGGFTGPVLTCPSCGEPRQRCQNKHMEGEDTCRSHAVGRPYSLYSRLAATLSDVAVEEFIERTDDGDLSQEYALAKLALSGILENQNISSKDLLENVKAFFDIAAKKKRIEEGTVLNISWNDDLANTLRKRWRLVIQSLGAIILRHVTKDILKEGIDPIYIQKLIFNDLRDETKVMGNHITLPIAQKQVSELNARAHKE